MRYKVGEKVRIRKDLETDKSYGEYKFLDTMERYKGKEATIKNVYSESYSVDLDNQRWLWTDDMLEPAEATIPYLQSKIDKLNSQMNRDFHKTKKEIKELKEQIHKLQSEEDKSILDKEEKEYLSAVIKPFRDKVEHIRKKYFGKDEYIEIKLIGNNSGGLPDFEKNTMYKGMERDRKYTLKELGL